MKIGGALVKLIMFCFFVAGCTQNEVIQLSEQNWLIFNSDNSALPDNQIHTIAIDHNDVKWIGTVNGLSRFDGISWTNYDTLNSALPSNFITSLSLGDHGNIWIGTNRGLALYNGSSWTLPEKLRGEFITRLFHDNKTGTLWIGTDRGLCKYDGVVWERYNDPETALLDVYVSSLSVDNKGLLWLGSFDHHSFVGRLLNFDGAKWTSFRLDEKGLPSSFPDALLVDNENVLWLGVKGTMGAMLVRIQGDKWEVFDQTTTNDVRLTGGINALTISGRTKWIASGAGLISYDGLAWSCLNTTNSDIPDDFVTTVEIDKTGRKWMGTVSGGVAVFN